MLLASLMPAEWFATRETWLLLIFVVLAMALVIKGADWLVEAAAALAMRLGMPKVVVGATIVSLGTTSPECAVSVLAAWSGNSGLALGNGVGSIIVDTGLIFGLGALLCALPADRFVLSRQGWVQVGSAALLSALCYGAFMLHGDAATIGRSVGILLVALLVVYLMLSVRWSRTHPANEPRLIAEGDQVQVQSELHEAPAQRGMFALVVSGVIGLIMVIVAGDGLVASVSVVAERWGMPQTVIAATLVAFGTSLPELIVGMTAIRKGHPALLVGNVIGADILNVLFVIGVSALAAPLEVVEDGNRIFLHLHLPTMLVMLLLFRLYIAAAVRRGRFSRWMGAPLVMMYVAYVIIQYAVSS
ncbi:MAG: sodium:calcium antiporter [Phycisphaeraceae bacterium]|nr:sodium:calcium antiporter [Phycisphaeraceae bacterium]